MLKKIFTIFLISICAQLASGEANNTSEAIHVSQAFVRAMPPGQKITAAFLTLKNTSDTDMSLIAVESDISEFVELHAHTMVDGMMSMGQVDEIIIPKNSSVSLETGGYHIMIINLKKDLVVGEKVDLTLKFKNGTSLLIQPEVKKQ